MTLVPALFHSTKPDPATDLSKLQPSEWNAIADLLTRVFDNQSAADGYLLQRDSTVASDGVSWTAGPKLPIPATGIGQFLQAKIGDHGAVGHFNFCIGYVANPGDSNRGNHVFTMGYNTTPGGGRADQTQPAFEYRIEPYYAPGGGNPGPFIEAHWQYYDATGASFRPIQIQINRTNGGYLTDATVNIQAVGFSYLGPNGTQYFKWSQAQMQIINSALMTIAANNYYWAKQLNAAGSGYIELPYINASDQLVLGGQSVTGIKALANAIASAATGKRYLVIDTAGIITSQASAPVGT